MLSGLELIAVNEFLIVSCAFSEVIGVKDLHFNVEGAIGALFLDINVRADTFAVGAKIDSLFAFGVFDFTDFNVENEFK